MYKSAKILGGKFFSNKTIHAIERCSEAERKGFTGVRGKVELKNFKAYGVEQKTKNYAKVIEGRPYSGHALDQMQNRGIPFSAVENAIKTGVKKISSVDSKCVEFHDVVNNLKVVVVKQSGNVRTVMFGAKK